jgi:hypothetical protein
VKRDLKDWCIIKELALDRKEWKLAIHVSEPWSSVPSFYCLLSSFFSPLFHLFYYRFIAFSPLLIWFFYRLLFSPFSLLFHTFFFAYVVLSLTYPTCLGIKGLVVGWLARLDTTGAVD